MLIVPDTAHGMAAVSWDTDEPTTGQIQWGTTALYGNTAAVPAPAALTHTVSIGGGALVPSQEYHVRITATDAASNSAYTSDRIFFLRPSPPTMVIAMPGDGRFDVRWEAPPQDNVVGYHVYRSSVSGGPYATLNATGLHHHEALMYPDLAVVNDATYFYVITAVDELGHESDRSEEVGGIPEANSGPTVVGGALVGNHVWTTKGSPYLVASHALVQAGSHLVVGPGVVVGFAASQILKVDGQLVVLGTEDATVTFDTDPLDPSALDWSGLWISPLSRGANQDQDEGTYRWGNLLHRASITGCTASALYVEGSSVVLSRADIHHNVHDPATGSRLIEGGRYGAGGVFVHGGAIVASRSRIRENRQGGDYGAGGLFAHGGTVQLFDSDVEQNLGANRLSAGGIQLIGARVVLIGSRIRGNRFPDPYYPRAGGVLASSRPSLVIVSSEVRDNSSDDHPDANGSAGGINFMGLDNSGDNVVYGSEISGNTAAGLFQCAGGMRIDAAGPRIIGNRFVDNSVASPVTEVAMDLHVYSFHLPTPGTVILGNQFRRSAGDHRPSLHLDNWVTLTGNQFVASDAQGPFVLLEYDRDPCTVDLTGNALVGTVLGRFLWSQYPASTCDLDATGSYWGAAMTLEADAQGAGADLSGIHDFYDDITLSRIRFDDWAHSAFPLARIDTPRWGRTFRQGKPVTFTGHADDPEDGPVTGAALSWSSSVDGLLGTGDALITSTLSVGPHQIWLTATDSLGQEGSIYVEIEIVP